MRIDEHKLMFHPVEVMKWFVGYDVTPIYVEISPSSFCNHKCSFCAMDFMRSGQFISTDPTIKSLIDMGRFGVKSIMFGGEGEPFFHPSIHDFTRIAKLSGMDVAFTTNGTKINFECLKYASWIKVSINGGDRYSYFKVHKPSSDCWNNVWYNLEETVRLRHSGVHSAKIGVQCVLLPDNIDSISNLIKKCGETEVDYLVLKPYSKHPSSKNSTEVVGLGMGRVESRCGVTAVDSTVKTPASGGKVPNALIQRWKNQAISSGTELIIRENAFSAINSKPKYQRCLSVPHFWAYISTTGDVYGCSTHLNDDRFKYGNINNRVFSKIWDGKYRKDAIDNMKYSFNIDNCRHACRMNEVNKYLWDLTNGVEHGSFI